MRTEQNIATELERLARAQLGPWRVTCRAELRGLPRLLEDGEQLLALAVASYKRLSGRLMVATDRRLILTYKWPLRPQRLEEIRYERLDSLHVEADKVTVTTAGKTLRFDLMPGHGSQLADATVQRIGGERVSAADRDPPPSDARRGWTSRLAPGAHEAFALALFFVVLALTPPGGHPIHPL
ncbi:MAG: PH domain-containing protein [Actinomycetota bacterium]|nr:PH domain-containing protein [Actinomycetota bacterium]